MRQPVPTKGSFVVGRQVYESEAAFWNAHTRERLAWRYDEEIAARIMAGQDEQSNADQRAWKNLGGLNVD